MTLKINADYIKLLFFSISSTPFSVIGNAKQESPKPNLSKNQRAMNHCLVRRGDSSYGDLRSAICDLMRCSQ